MNVQEQKENGYEPEATGAWFGIGDGLFLHGGVSRNAAPVLF
jgi:hypothetical protein